MRNHCDDIKYFIKHAAQIGKDCTTNGNALACADRWTISFLILGFDLLCILCQLRLPDTELLLCLLHIGTEVFSIGETITLSRGWRAYVSHSRSQDTSNFF